MVVKKKRENFIPKPCILILLHSGSHRENPNKSQRPGSNSSNSEMMNVFLGIKKKQKTEHAILLSLLKYNILLQIVPIVFMGVFLTHHDYPHTHLYVHERILNDVRFKFPVTYRTPETSPYLGRGRGESLSVSVPTAFLLGL